MQRRATLLMIAPEWPNTRPGWSVIQPQRCLTLRSSLSWVIVHGHDLGTADYPQQCVYLAQRTCIATPAVFTGRCCGVCAVRAVCSATVSLSGDWPPDEGRYGAESTLVTCASMSADSDELTSSWYEDESRSRAGSGLIHARARKIRDASRTASRCRLRCVLTPSCMRLEAPSSIVKCHGQTCAHLLGDPILGERRAALEQHVPPVRLPHDLVAEHQPPTRCVACLQI